jgi:hypothetical protein
MKIIVVVILMLVLVVVRAVLVVIRKEIRVRSIVNYDSKTNSDGSNNKQLSIIQETLFDDN